MINQQAGIEYLGLHLYYWLQFRLCNLKNSTPYDDTIKILFNITSHGF
jgi:hypothetical protein